jgi:hypothetical protein
LLDVDGAGAMARLLLDANGFLIKADRLLLHTDRFLLDTNGRARLAHWVRLGLMLRLLLDHGFGVWKFKM